MHEYGPSEVAFKRNALADLFLESEQFGALFFLDADMVPPPFALLRLLGHGLPIVGGLYFQRGAPFRTCAGYDRPTGGHLEFATIGTPPPLKRVDWIGTGALLIRREALQQVPRPFFDYPRGETEDIHFSRQARAAGLPIYVDTELCVGHMTPIAIGMAHVSAWWAMERARLAR